MEDNNNNQTFPCTSSVTTVSIPMERREVDVMDTFPMIDSGNCCNIMAMEYFVLPPSQLKKFSSRSVWEANDDYKAGLLAEKEAKAESGEQVRLEKQQGNDLERTISECEARLEKARRIVQMHLWSKYGEVEMATAIQEAENACDDAAAIHVSSTNCDDFKVQLAFLEKLVKKATKAVSAWEQWIPAEEKDTFESRVKVLRVTRNRLEARRVEFVAARRVAEEGRTAAALLGSVMPAMPIIKIKPTSLSKFRGCRRDFHHWRKGWESLQKQGELTGSSEVKKIQLLDSVDDKIIKDLRLSAYNTAEDMLRVLEYRYGNKTCLSSWLTLVMVSILITYKVSKVTRRGFWLEQLSA
ncbi:hypothetical protein SRHO_G00109920 [Serrasalmus rhombeus]